MPFEWTSRRPPQDTGPLRTYNGRPEPPWPPADVPAEGFGCCLDCAVRTTPCADGNCPRMAWRRGTVIVAARPAPDREPHLLRRLIRAVKGT